MIMRRMMFTAASLGILAAFAGCSDDTEARTYTVPKEETPTPQAAPVAAPQMPAEQLPMSRQTLPEGSVNLAGDGPSWTVPEAWTAAGGSSMRRASFAAEGPDGPVDISVTSFPGDVGGMLANVNRWRGQVGLTPLAESELEANLQRLTVNGKEAIISNLEGPDSAMVVATIKHEGNSWFFRIAGPVNSVREQRAAFDAFVGSIQFEN